MHSIDIELSNPLASFKPSHCDHIIQKFYSILKLKRTKAFLCLYFTPYNSDNEECRYHFEAVKFQCHSCGTFRQWAVKNLTDAVLLMEL